MGNNPYCTQPGFGLRVHRARSALKKFAINSADRPTSRSFDNCFEMYDGDAVVWQLMRDVVTGDELLERGIRRMGGQLFADWMNVYDPGTRERCQLYFDFLSEQQRQGGAA